MKKELLLFILAGVLTLVISIGFLRRFAPPLLGLPPDLQLVKVAEKVPPFFEGVFREEDQVGDRFIIPDPYIMRSRPFFPRLPTIGPNDLLGFRNSAVPAVADVVVIGDSLTYGNNVHLEQNWPSRLAARLGDPAPVIYNMSVGGWGGVEYGEIFDKSLHLRPYAVVVAFYTGNDPLETFIRAYGGERWKDLRPDPSLSAADSPRLSHPPQGEEGWPVKFGDGTETVFTPKVRSLSSGPHPAVDAGYAMLVRIAAGMTAAAADRGADLLFTVIPTKELVFRRKIELEEVSPPPEYVEQVDGESKRIEKLSRDLGGIPGARYVDVVDALQEAALTVPALYPEGTDGHPLASGYDVIAGMVAGPLEGILPRRPEGVVSVKSPEGKYFPYLVREGGLWSFTSREVFVGNGWSLNGIPIVSQRVIDGIPFVGEIDVVDPRRFGPPEHGGAPTGGDEAKVSR